MSLNRASGRRALLRLFTPLPAWTSAVRIRKHLRLPIGQSHTIDKTSTSHQLSTAMDADGDFDIDPAIAAAMGFGGFGSQTKGKRKFGANDSFVDTNKANPASATGANNLPVREHKAARVSQNADDGGASDGAGGLQQSSAPVSHYDPKTQESPSLESLRHGVRNPNGGIIYFLPSFLEDPWAGMKPQ